MKKTKKWPKRLGLGIFIFLIIVLLGPVPKVEPITERTALPEDVTRESLDQWLAKQESEVEGLTYGMARQVHWRDPVKKLQTELAIVYVHSFGACPEDTFPMATRVAKALNANLHYVRITGHAIDPKLDQLKHATAERWMQDVIQGVEIGKLIGQKVMLVGTALGGTASAWYAQQFPDQVDYLVSMSPEFAMAVEQTRILTWPWAEQLIPLLKPRYDRALPAQYFESCWTPHYDIQALIEANLLIKHTRDTGFDAIKAPTLVFYSEKDQLSDVQITKRELGKWGSEVELVEITDSEATYQHILAGNLTSPETTPQVVQKIVEFYQREEDKKYSAD